MLYQKYAKLGKALANALFFKAFITSLTCLIAAAIARLHVRDELLKNTELETTTARETLFEKEDAMYYEDLGLYFHDKDLFNAENPVTRDELWQDYCAFDDDCCDDESRRFVKIEFNISALTSDEIADLEWELATTFPFGEYHAYTDADGNDTGDREIGGSTDAGTYWLVCDTLESYGLTFDDFTIYE